MSTSMKTLYRWLIILLTGVSCGMIYGLPYLRSTFHSAMEIALGYNNFQIGLMMSIYGFVSLLLYTPSGILADKFSHRKLIGLALITTGALAFVMATYPPFFVGVIVQIAWAITTTLLMYSAMVKSTTLLGNSNESGNLIGWLCGFRGAGDAIMVFLAIWIFSKFGAEKNPDSLKAVYILYGVVFIILGCFCYKLIPDGKVVSSEDDKYTWKDVVKCLKIKTTWYTSFCIMGVYSVAAILSYTAPYLRDVFGMSIVSAALISTVRNQVFRFISGPIGGLLTIKTPLKSSTKIVTLCSFISLFALVVLLIVQPSNAIINTMIAMVLFVGFFNYMAKNLYLAIVSEVGTPPKVAGTTVGIACVIGFSADVYVYPIIGLWQDSLPPVEAYRNMWVMGLAFTVLAIVFGCLLLKEMKKNAKKA